MKKILIAAMLFTVLYSCSQPMKITANPDSRGRTSGTLGSTTAENYLPSTAVDTTKINDTLRIKRNQ